MFTSIIIRLGATVEFGLLVAEQTGWFSHALPMFGSPTSQGLVVFCAPVLISELASMATESIARLRDWWRRR